MCHQLCVDFDECRSPIAVCNRNARCHNTIGSYRCECIAGYIGDGKQCNYVGLGIDYRLDLITFI